MVVMYGEARALLVDGKVVETGMYLPILRLFLRSEASRPRMSGIRSLMRGCCGGECARRSAFKLPRDGKHKQI